MKEIQEEYEYRRNAVKRAAKINGWCIVDIRTGKYYVEKPLCGMIRPFEKMLVEPKDIHTK